MFQYILFCNMNVLHVFVQSVYAQLLVRFMGGTSIFF